MLFDVNNWRCSFSSNDDVTEAFAGVEETHRQPSESSRALGKRVRTCYVTTCHLLMNVPLCVCVRQLEWKRYTTTTTTTMVVAQEAPDYTSTRAKNDLLIAICDVRFLRTQMYLLAKINVSISANVWRRCFRLL